MTSHFDLIVIGSGPGGYMAAIRAAELGLKTACIEKAQAFGGTCLNQGCIPSKCLLESSEFYAHFLRSGKLHGIEGDFHLHFSQMMERKNGIVASLGSGITGLFKKSGVTSISGVATFKDPNTIRVGEKEYGAKQIILATGSEPTSLPFLPYDEKQILSSTGALALQRIPKTLLVIGAGIIGIELGSVYSRLGAQVTCIESCSRICPTLDAHLSRGLQKALEKQGLTFFLSSKVLRCEKNLSDVTLVLEGGQSVRAEKVLVAVGRRPYTQHLGLETIGIIPDQKGCLPVDQNCRLLPYSHLYAIGDLISGPMLAHRASEEGYAVATLIAGKDPPSIESIAIPSVVYTNPEVGAVGLSEEEAKERHLPFQTHTHFLKGNGRARCMGDDSGFIKLIVHTPSQTLLGAHILSPHAGDLIAMATLALQTHTSIQAISQTCIAHPTLSEAFKEAARAFIDVPPFQMKRLD